MCVCTLTCFHKKMIFCSLLLGDVLAACTFHPQTENDLDLPPFAGHGHCWSVGQKSRVMS